MSATDELRRLLDERGVKYYDMQNHGIWFGISEDGKDHKYEAFEQTDGLIEIDVFDLTPEQAIAATLGKQGYYTDRDDEGTHIMCDRCGGYIGTAEEIAATLRRGECELVYGETDRGVDSWFTQCGGRFAATFEDGRMVHPKFCQLCGSKAVKR